MAKITLDPMVGSYASVTALNSRFQQIEDAFNDDVLWRSNPAGETNTMQNDLDMNGYRILNTVTFASDASYLGKFATAPTTDNEGNTLDSTHEGYIYYNSTSKDVWVWNGSAWGLIGTTQNSAASVTIADSGANYDATNVEGALAELASTTAGQGASIIGVNDAGSLLTATNVEAALQELASNINLRSYNWIINGNFDFWQRAWAAFTSAKGSLASQDMWADRFGYLKTGTTAVHTAQRLTDVPTTAESGTLSEFSLNHNVTTADTSVAAGDYNAIYYIVEGPDYGKLFGQTVTLSFWVKSDKTGTYCIAFSNKLADRHYVTEYTIDSAATWEKKTVTLTLDDTLGTWDQSPTTVGLSIYWTLMAGSTYQTGSTDAWTAGTAYATANQVNFNDTIGNDFQLAQVKLEVGSVATPIIHYDYATEYARCDRYCQWYYDQPASGVVSATNTISVLAFPFRAPLMKPPTAFTSNWSGTPVIQDGTTTRSISAIGAVSLDSRFGVELSVTHAASTSGQGAVLKTTADTTILVEADF